jgi:hypothetical protein
MQIEFDLPMTAFDTSAVEAAFHHYIARCVEHVAAGKDYPWAGHKWRLEELLKDLKRVELDAVTRVERSRKKPRHR